MLYSDDLQRSCTISGEDSEDAIQFISETLEIRETWIFGREWVKSLSRDIKCKWWNFIQRQIKRSNVDKSAAKTANEIVEKDFLSHCHDCHCNRKDIWGCDGGVTGVWHWILAPCMIWLNIVSDKRRARIVLSFIELDWINPVWSWLTLAKMNGQFSCREGHG